ncbi:MAG TPA: 2,3-dihydro-2,3-dihydroxybenzoate dehydrogenase [Streptosporangiaceae bacterium]|nr:2,3-dihydro-2,3-dihydroxybenzoate dehydrogenase [Streptosporangiaceae bacterium]
MNTYGRVALVTGAAQGIGASVVRAFAECGVFVAAVDSNADGLAVRTAALSALGHQVAGYPVDVRDSAAVEELVDQVEREHGPVDILVNAAGVLRTGPVTTCTDADWSIVLSVNTTGVFNVSRSLAVRMAARNRGTIITVASNAGGVPRLGMAAYAASKAATAMFTKCLGLELAAHGIRCNVVSPGSTDTPMLRGMWPGKGESDQQAVIDGRPEAFRVGIPLRKLALPQDVADAVLFLASDRAGHITMQDLYVDGGAALKG